MKNTKSKLNFIETQLNWKLLKQATAKFMISYSKAITKKEKARRLKLENTLKILGNNLTDNVKKQQYELLKYNFDEICDKIAQGVRVQSRCQHYNHRQKSSKFFLNLEKVPGSQRKVRIASSREINDPQKTQHEIYSTKAFSRQTSKRSYQNRQTFKILFKSLNFLTIKACCAKENQLRVNCTML